MRREHQGEGWPEASILAAEGFVLAGKGLGGFWQRRSVSSSEMLRSGRILTLQSCFLLHQTDIVSSSGIWCLSKKSPEWHRRV